MKLAISQRISFTLTYDPRNGRVRAFLESDGEEAGGFGGGVSI